MSREEKRALQEEEKLREAEEAEKARAEVREEEDEEDEDEEEEEMEPKQKLIQILVSSILLIAAVLVTRAFPDLAMWQKLLIFLIPYAAAGFDVLKEAIEHIGEGEVFDEDFLTYLETEPMRRNEQTLVTSQKK